MALNSIQQFSTTAASNTDIAGVNVNTGWPPGNVGTAFRTLMSFLADSFIPQPIAMTGSTLTLTAAQATAGFIQFTGTPGATCTVTIPANGMFGCCQNAASDGSSAILTTGSGTTLTLAAGVGAFYYCDGANVTQVLATAQAWQEIANVTLSGSSGQTFNLNGFSRYRLTFQGLTVNTNTAFMECRFSTNGGSSFISTSSYNQFGFNNTNPTMAAFNQVGASALLTLGLSTNAGSVAEGVYEFYCGSGSLPASCNGTTTFFDSSGFWGRGQFSNTLNAGAAINAMQVFASGGTYSGQFILEGLP